MGGLTGIVFDYGGTLSQTPSLSATLELVLDDERAADIGACIEWQIEDLYTPDQVEQPPWQPVWQRAFERSGATFSEETGYRHLAAFVDAGEPYDYTRPLLAHLRDSPLKVGLLSHATGPTELFEQGLEKRRIADCFDATVWSCETNTRKPGRRAFEIIAERMGEALPDLMMVGDSEVADVGGGAAAGMMTVCVYDGESLPDSKADHIIQRDMLQEFLQGVVIGQRNGSQRRLG